MKSSHQSDGQGVGSSCRITRIGADECKSRQPGYLGQGAFTAVRPGSRTSEADELSGFHTWDFR